MKRSILFTAASALGLFALNTVAFAGRDGSKDEKSNGAAPAGSATFHPAPQSIPRPAPQPRPEPSFVRPPNPVTEHFVPPIPKQEQKEERHAPPSAGSAAVLPGANTNFHPPKTTEIHAPPVQPPKGKESPEDFLGLRGEPRKDSRVAPVTAAASTRFTAPVAPAVTAPTEHNRAPALTPFRPSEQVSRFLNQPTEPSRQSPINRPVVPERWKSTNANYSSQASHWVQANAASVANFQANRAVRWNQIQSHRTAAAWRGQYHTPSYRQWRQNYWSYRQGRAAEIWEQTQGLYENLFDDQWWASCWWRRHPWTPVTYVPPWWWWSSPTWTDLTAFFGPSIGPAPIDYDPGTNVFYDDGTYDVDGQDHGPAANASEAAIGLGSPPVTDIPVPEPAPEGQPQEWLPLGSWALTQQEQGDAVLYFQLSVNRAGLVAGGYKNALTGDEQPIVGQVDKSTQRLAWHIANAPQTVFETGLSSLDYDVAGVFVHFGPDQVQNWLLVRLPSPDLPPGPARIPPETN